MNLQATWDLSQALREERLRNDRSERVQILLIIHVVGRAQDRSGLDEITLFKSVGTAIQDVAAGFVARKELVGNALAFACRRYVPNADCRLVGH